MQDGKCTYEGGENLSSRAVTLARGPTAARERPRQRGHSFRKKSYFFKNLTIFRIARIGLRSRFCQKCDISNSSFLKIPPRMILLCRNVAGWTVMGTMSAGSLSMLLKGLVQDSISRSLWAGGLETMVVGKSGHLSKNANTCNSCVG